MKQYLLVWDGNWADEMNLDGHVVLNQEELDIFLEAVNGIDYLDFGVGTNEDIEYNSREEIKQSYTYNRISSEQERTLVELTIYKSGFAESFVECVIDKYNDRDED